MHGILNDDEVEGEVVEVEASASETGAPIDEQPNEAPLTRAELQALLDDREQKILGRAQSMTDKASGRLERRLRELHSQDSQTITLLKNLPGITEAQVKEAEAVLKRDVMQRALQTGQPEQANGQPPAGQPMPDAQAVTAAGQTIAEKYGLTKDAPELALIVTDGSPQDYLRSIEYAGKLYEQRVKGAPKGGPQPKPSRSPAMLPSGGRTQPDKGKLSRSAALEAEARKMFGSG